MAKKTFSKWLKTLNADPTTDAAIHYDDMQKALFERGITNAIDQKFLYSREQKIAGFSVYLEEIARQVLGVGTKTGKGSTDVFGKPAEVGQRLLYSIHHDAPFAIADMRARAANVRDISIAVEKSATEIESKSGQGTIAAGHSPAEAKYAAEDLERRNPVYVWYYNPDLVKAREYVLAHDAEKFLTLLQDTDYICMRFNDLMQWLESYKGTLDTWIVAAGLNKANGNYSIKFQQVKDSKVKREWLEKGQFEQGMDIFTVFETREW